MVSTNNLMVGILINIYKSLLKHLSGHGLYKYQIFRKLNQTIRLSIATNTTEIRGLKYYLGPSNYKRFSVVDMEKVGEPLEMQQMKLNIKNGDVVIDIGANIGLYTLPISKFVQENGKVFAFEPHPKNFEILQKNVTINNIKNIILENKAVSNHNGNAKLFASWVKNDDGTCKLFRIKGQPSDFTDTTVVSLDNYFHNKELIDKISFVKIDVEGVEFDVLKGMEKILQTNSKIQLILEFIPRQLVNYGTDPKEMLDFLISKGFKIYWFDYGEDKKIKPIENFEKLISGYEYQSINIYCKRN